MPLYSILFDNYGVNVNTIQAGGGGMLASYWLPVVVSLSMVHAMCAIYCNIKQKMH
jgi:hypothetical protein